MPADLPHVHVGALNTTRQIVAAVGADQWSNPTPCEAWDVRALVNHIVTGNWWAAELAAGRTIDDVGTRLDGDVLDSDPTGSYDASAAAAAAVFLEPGAMQRECAVSYGPVPGEVYCGHRILDVLIHGWDVAKATGQGTGLPVDLVDACIEIVTPQAEMLAGSGMFDTGVEASSPDSQTRLLAMLGRRH